MFVVAVFMIAVSWVITFLMSIAVQEPCVDVCKAFRASKIELVKSANCCLTFMKPSLESALRALT